MGPGAGRCIERTFPPRHIARSRRRLHSATAMATHPQVRQWVKDNHGWSVQHGCRITRFKDLAGLKPRRA